MEGVVLSFSPLLVDMKVTAPSLDVDQLSAVRQVGGAELHLQEDNRVPLSRGVYTLSASESGQVEGASP